MQPRNVLLIEYFLRWVSLIEGISGLFLIMTRPIFESLPYDLEMQWVGLCNFLNESCCSLLPNKKYSIHWPSMDSDVTKEYCSNFRFYGFFFSAKPKIIKLLEKWKICSIRANYRRYVCMRGWSRKRGRNGWVRKRDSGRKAEWERRGTERSGGRKGNNREME